MHKKIVESIKYVIENSPIRESCKIYVAQNNNSDGFWAMIVICENDSHIKHIESTAIDIGRMYGEGLHTVTKKSYIEID